MTTPGATARPAGTCFVVMGFGKKTDFETGRTLDLDKTYKYIIKPAVMAAGLACVRADEIKHSGPIDVPMYEQLLGAEVVIADLSTSNKNAYYELGVRHALRPHSTIIICEDGIKTFPFDVNHTVIQQYHHLGEGIDFGEVERFRTVITELIVAILEKDPPRPDSPVYTFLDRLTPPMLREVAEALAVAAPAAAGAAAPAAGDNPQLYSELMDDVEEAQKRGDFEEAKSLLKIVRKRTKPAAGQAEDPYIVQRLAFVTYKAKYPTRDQEIAALHEARALLAQLTPDTSNDTETLGLWGAVHKRLWDKAEDAAALDTAVRSYGRGFYLRNDHYNGINVAFLLNVRARHALRQAPAGSPEAVAQLAAAIADYVQAQRVRDEVARICDTWLASHQLAADASEPAKKEHAKAKYWVVVTKAEALLGMGKIDAADATYAEAFAMAPEPWMIDTAREQRVTLEGLLADSPLKHLQQPS